MLPVDKGGGFRLLDTQWMTPQLRQFGGYELPRKDYLAALCKALCKEKDG